MIFRVYHELKGGHVHMRVFSGPADGSLGKCGDLIMRVDEFNVFRRLEGLTGGLLEFRREGDSER